MDPSFEWPVVFLILIAVAFLWMLISSIPLQVARYRGHADDYLQVIGWWLFGFFFWPVALIVALLLKNQPGSQAERKQTAKEQDRPVNI